MGQFVRHEPCPECGSSDGLGRYDNGTATCFVCGYYDKGTGEIEEQVTTQTKKDWVPLRGEVTAIPNRGLNEATCKHWGYEKGTYEPLGSFDQKYAGKTCHIATFRDSQGHVVGQKIRLPGKTFLTRGDMKSAPLYGQWLWSGGKHLVITEGEIDALSMSQAFDNKWPVVSLPAGAQSAEKAFTNAYEWLDRFDRIVLMFDMDEPGQEAAKKVAALLPPGKAAIAELPAKDANDVLRQNGKAALMRCFWDAPIWKPDGIVSGEEFTLDMLKKGTNVGFTLPYPKLQERTLGIRKGEITMLTAGSGIGKSTFAREVAYYLHQTYNLCIGNIFLEEGNVKTAQGYVALHNNVPLGELRANPELLTEKQWREGLKVVQSGMWFYNHFGSLDSTNLLGKMRYLAVVCKVDFIILDHISIVTSGVESSREGERKDIDILMTRLSSLVEETGVGIIGVVHLKRSKEKSFNEGDKVSLSDLRGSGSLEQLSHNVWAIERNQQAKGHKATMDRLRVLKERETGYTGEADILDYNRKTGRLLLSTKDCPFDDDDEDDPFKEAA